MKRALALERGAFARVGVRVAISACAISAVLFAATEPAARADQADEGAAKDTSDGRFDGALSAEGAVGVTAGPRGPRAALDARFRYLSTAGIFFSYEDGPLFGSSAEPRRALAFGLELRPLFLARWATGTEIGNPRVDLLIDSLALELGAVFTQPEGASFAQRGGLELGLGFELPFLPSASGPFLGVHGGARWSETALSGGPLVGPADRALYLTLVVGWQVLFGSSVVDFDDSKRAAR